MLALAILFFFVLLTANLGRTLLTPRTTVRADFTSATSLRVGSSVRLAGVHVGSVASIKFVKVRYGCDPVTEDLGRFGDGRTDDCDGSLFCTSAGWCGSLEPWAGRGEHTRCDTSEDCPEDETCITGAFRDHSPHVDWGGPVGVCARSETEHWRALVEMDIRKDAMPLIRTDSRAMLASNSALGDILVDISQGRGPALGDDQRIQSRPSLADDIDRLRRRVDRFMQEADDSVVALLSVVSELKDEPTIDALQGFFFNVEIISRDLAYGRGVVGALLASPHLRREVGTIVAALRSTSVGMEDGVASLRRIGATIDRNSGPVLADADAALRQLDALLVGLRDPENQSVVAHILRDPEGKMVADLTAVVENGRQIISSVAALAAAIETGKGTLGRLIGDPFVMDRVTRLLRSIAQRDVLRFALEVVLERNGFPVAEARSSAGPPR